MMYGRGFGGGFGGGRNFNGNFDNGNFNNFNCFRYGFMNNGWNIVIIIGVMLIIALLIYIFVHNKNKKVNHQSALDVLKMKYVQGDMTEEEYLRRKSLLDKE